MMLTEEALAEIIVAAVSKAVAQATAPLVARLAAVEGREYAPLAVVQAHGDHLVAIKASVAEIGARGALTPEYVKTQADSFIACAARLETLEARALLPGPQGEPGASGPQGPQGEPGPAGTVDITALEAIERRVDALDAARADRVELSADELAVAWEELLRAGLSDLGPAPATQKRIVRDAQGRIERVVDEPVGRQGGGE